MSKPTPKADALRAMRESNAAPVTRAGERMPIDDDVTTRVAALLVRAQDRISAMPTIVTPDEALIQDLARALAAAFDEGDDWLDDTQLELPDFLTREPRA